MEFAIVLLFFFFCLIMIAPLVIDAIVEDREAKRQHEIELARLKAQEKTL